ncbi:zinc transporter ZIP10 [Xenopus laevis]|uniref:Zinc transporter ZIP10 n=2 Tax=Xenopus laevis TaxID=8355 RepID=A0A1L8HHT8_XENLA|nr:zinc transporter ZIP10 [Xenopus laevis]XP_041438432.1 zinc transporter ZIP10 [Xenopus laevis]OCT95670.1 hypothetical protein XELAEV_18013358mg [Xenopus laevis]
MLFHKVCLVLQLWLWTFFPFCASQLRNPSKQNLSPGRPHPLMQALLTRTHSDKERSLSLEEAEKEQGYYLQQLFHLYGENDTLSYEGLTLLLQNLGLGKVQVVEIEHTDLGHDHVSHLDILDVQGNKHSHAHSSREHLQSSTTMPLPVIQTKNARSVEVNADITQPVHAVPKTRTSTKMPPHNEKRSTTQSRKRQWPTEDILKHVIQLQHSPFSHQHDDCLNVTQLLINFGLSWVSEITPEQFTLLCPALLYQIDSRVCIHHNDELTNSDSDSKQALLQVLGWGALAVTVISAPSLLAVAFVPLLRRPLFRSLLRFLVALAVGTLCGDALLHLLPHAQEDHSGNQHGGETHAIEPVLKGLSVLGGVYLLFLIENLMGLLKQRRQRKRLPKPTVPAGDEGYTTALWDLGSPVDSEFCEVSRAAESVQRSSEEVEIRRSNERAASSHHGHSGHSHNIAGKGITEIVWMVLLGDGIHNFTDGLAIGAAFSSGFSGGLSTTVAVFCHELPHELGDFAVLLQNGVPVRKVLFFSLVSALLSFVGMIIGAVASQSSAQITPWIFAATAGIFLYVALVDMLPQMLNRDSADPCQVKDCIIHSLGFPFGCAIMFCIALYQDQMAFLDL